MGLIPCSLLRVFKEGSDLILRLLAAEQFIVWVIVIKNSLFIFCGRIANSIFLFLLTLTISRLLGPALFGTYSFLTTVVLTGSYFANYGLDTLMVREVAKDQNVGKACLTNILGLKLLTSFLTIALIALLFQLISLDPKTNRLLLILLISLLFNSLSQTLWYYGDGFEKFIYHSLLWPMSNFIKSAIGIVLVIFFQDIFLLIWGLVVAEIISFGLSYALIRNRFGTCYPSFDLSKWYKLIMKATPLAIGVILSALYFRLDIIMLKLMKGDEVVGLYSAAYKLIEAFTIFPSVIVMVLFPSLVKDYNINIHKLKEKMNKSLIYFISMGVICAVFLSMFSKKIIVALYGNNFVSSSITLQVLSWALLFIFINYLLSYVLISVGKEKKNTINLLIITSINIGLNLLLIPEYGHIGAGWATLISEFVLMVLCGFAIKTVVVLPALNN